MTRDEFVGKVIPLGNKMRRLANLLLHDDELAKDAVQESYMKLWRKRKELSRCYNLRAYVVRTVRNACLDKLRSARTNIHIRDDHAVNDYNRDYDFAESANLIRRVIETLPGHQRQVIELRDIEGYSYEEIVEALDMTVNNIRVSLSLARKKVREELLKIQNYGLKRD